MKNRLLIVGSGSIGKRHFDVARTLYPNLNIRFLSRNTKSPQSKVTECIYSWSEVDEFNPDIAIIANPAPFHSQVGINLAKRGVHLLVEKPISYVSSDANLLISECRANNVLLKVGYNLRYLSSLKAFQRFIGNSIVGHLISVRAEVGQYLPSWRKGVDYRGTVSARKDLGGGVLLELSHEIDYLNWIFGTPESVFGIISKQSNLDVDVEDNVDLLIRYCVNKDEKKFLVANLSMDFVRLNSVRQCTVIGSTGSIRWDGLANIVEKYNPSEKAWSLIYKGEDTISETYFAQMKDFMNKVLTNDYSDEGPADSLKVLHCIEAARNSNNLGSMCLIDYNLK